MAGFYVSIFTAHNVAGEHHKARLAAVQAAYVHATEPLRGPLPPPNSQALCNAADRERGAAIHRSWNEYGQDRRALDQLGGTIFATEEEAKAAVAASKFANFLTVHFDGNRSTLPGTWKEGMDPRNTDPRKAGYHVTVGRWNPGLARK